jgi:L-glutamine:2-deoxy-scyllo-inosose/3-amino-2,3-dideoxy-scyllo-inosose aminotransferase
MSTIEWPGWPISDGNTLEAVREVLESGRWAISGPFAGSTSQEQRFADAFARWNCAPFCVTLDHGTSALIAALEALEIGFGDEVIVPGMTWVAPAIAVLSVNATPVIVDVEEDTFCMSASAAREAITPRTRALLPVHLYGCMADMDALLALAGEHDLSVVEDAAHSHGSEWNGRKAGTMGRIGVFSFQQGKVLTCGEGGAAITAEAMLRERIELSAWNSRTRLEPRGVKLGDMQLVEGTSRFGTNRCLSELQAAIALEQLSRLDEQNEKRERNARWLDARLGEIPGLLPMRRHPSVDRQTYYGYVVRVDAGAYGTTAHALIPRLRATLGMGDFRLHAPYRPLHQNPLYRPHPRRHDIDERYAASLDVSRVRLPAAEKGFRDGIVFHHSVLLGDEPHMRAIVEAFRGARG